MKKHPLRIRCVFATVLVTVFWLTSVRAAEPDEVLAALDLPSDPKILNDFEPVFESSRPIQSEAEAETKISVIRKFEMKHVGDSRLLVRVEFDQTPYKGESARYNLYLDTDNNLTTGRQDESAPGIDLMANIAQTRQNLSLHNPALTAQNTAFRSVFDGKILYITVETPLPATGERIPLAGWVLAQRGNPAKSSMSDNKLQFTVPRGKVNVAPLTQTAEAKIL